MLSSSNQPKRAFRADINGLRAWAVIVVLLFHFKVSGFEAGFIGVDIFFVISGFLMTGIIARGLSQDSFSIWEFYIARLRRIVPAVATLITMLLALGWFWLPTTDYKALGSESAYSLGFLSNIYYWRSAGYFDTAAQEKWLLHTWSLGVEMQFYILFPIFALIVWKLKPSIKAFIYSLVAICFASLVLSILVSSLRPAAAFYLIPTRGWELTAGGLVYFLGQKQISTALKRGLYFAGLLLWLVGFIIIDSHLPWPSGWALFPVLGTAFIIAAAQENTLLMGNKIAQWLGNISYSVYLWHWPLVVALYFSGLQDNWTWIIGFFALSLVLGDLSYRFIETPTRKGLTKISFGKQVVTFAAVVLVIGLSAVSIRLFTFDGRMPVKVQQILAEIDNLDPRKPECHRSKGDSKHNVGCIYGGNEVGAILIGDSHTAATITAFAQASHRFSKSVRSFSSTACPTVRGLYSKWSDLCYEFNNEILNSGYLFVEYPKRLPLILLNRTSLYIKGANEDFKPKPIGYFDSMNKDLKEVFSKALIDTACDLNDKYDVYLTRPIPEMGRNVPKTLARNMMMGINKEDIKITLDEYHDRQSFVWKIQDDAVEKCGVKILNPLPYLCDDKYCYGSKNGRPLYYDDDHLSEYGNKFLVPMFEQVFEDQKGINNGN